MVMRSPQVFLFHLRRSINQFRYTRVLILLVLVCFFVYPFAPTFPTSDLRPIRSRFRAVDTQSYDSQESRHLWSYITEYNRQAEVWRRQEGEDNYNGPVVSEGSTGAWEWVNSQRKTKPPSAGALADEGAQASFRDNLRGDKQYYIGFLTSGWNNQVMDTCNSIYLSILSGRVPILPGFEAHTYHLGGLVTTVAVGEIFDLTFLSSALGNYPLVEAHELKAGERQSPRLQVIKGTPKPRRASTANHRREPRWIKAVQPVDQETLGCWRFKPMRNPFPHLPFQSLDVLYTPMPRHVLHKGDLEHPSILAVADLFRKYKYGQIPSDSIEQLNGELEELPPDQQVACLDWSYFLMLNASGPGLHHEWRSGGGVWHFVGQYMRFQPALVRIADDYLKDSLGLSLNGPRPVYMGVHIRRGDFGNWFRDFSPLHWAYKVSKALAEVRDRTGVTIPHVVVTTDETDEDWLNQLRAYGITVLDHKKSRTQERLDKWFPTIIDSIILGSGKAFIGVGVSTMSILAMRRVIDWHSGMAWLLDYPEMDVPEDFSWHLDDFVKGS